jgi:radical SAM protein with 4Fe4S-binding SPASM domain
MALWRRVVDEVAQHGAALRITPDGEPMLLKTWEEQVAYVQERGVATFAFNTNGMFLEGAKADVLLRESDTKVSVEVSLDGFYRDTYEQIRVRGDYRRILRNIMDFVMRRDKLGRDNVKLMVSIVQQPEVSDEELRVFDRFWSRIADKVIIRNYVDTKGLTPKKQVDERQVAERWPCLVVFTRLVVTWDGRVRFCPDDWMKETTLTTLEEAGSLQAVWQSEAFRALRQSHLDRTFTHPTCATCTDWKVIRWGFDYTKALQGVFAGEAPREDNVDRFVVKSEAA